MFGWHAKWPVELFNVWCTQTVCQDTQGEAYARVRERTTRQLECQKELYNKRIHGNPFKVGDHVWVLFPQAPRGKLRKLCRPWSCPFVVGKKLSCYAQSAGDKQSSLKNGHRFWLAEAIQTLHLTISDLKKRTSDVGRQQEKHGQHYFGNSLEVVNDEVNEPPSPI